MIVLKKMGLPALIAILQTLQFATMGVWVRMMEGSFTTNQQVYIRILLAALLAWIIFWPRINKDSLRKLTQKDLSTYFVRSTLSFGIGVLFFTVAVQNIALGTSSFVVSLPIMGLLGWLFFRERLVKGALPIIAFSVVGLALLSQISLQSLVPSWGIIAAIISVLGFDVAYLMARMHPKHANNYQNTAIVLSFGWLVPFVLILLSGDALLPSHVTSLAWIGLAASVVTNILGLYMINYVMTNMKAYVAGNIFLLEGVFALLIGLIFYSEVPTLVEIVGASIIVGCAYMLALKEHKSEIAIQ